MTPPWVLIVVACITLVGVLVTAIVTNLVNARNNRAIQARWASDQGAMETRWRTELDALDTRTVTGRADEERKDRRAKAIEIYELASQRAISDDPKISQLGVNELKALLKGDLLDADMKPLVIAALNSSYASEAKVIEQAESSDEHIDVVQVDLEALEAGNVSLTEREEPDHADEGEEGTNE